MHREGQILRIWKRIFSVISWKFVKTRSGFAPGKGTRPGRDDAARSPRLTEETRDGHVREHMVQTGPKARQPRTSVRSARPKIGLTPEVGGFARLNHRLTSGGHGLLRIQHQPTDFRARA